MPNDYGQDYKGSMKKSRKSGKSYPGKKGMKYKDSKGAVSKATMHMLAMGGKKK